MTDQMGIHRWFSIYESVLHGKDSAASSHLRSTTMWTRPHAGARPMQQSLRVSHFMAFIAFMAFAFTLTTFMAFIAFIAFAFTLTTFMAFIAFLFILLCTLRQHHF